MDKSSIKIILIDDDSQSREAISSHLIEAGYQVLLMANIRNSYPAVKKAMPDLIMLAVSKPKVYSHAFVKNLKESDWGKNIPLLIFDEDDTDDDTSSSFKGIPAESILKKPPDFREIDKKLKNFIQQKQAPQSIEEQETIQIDTSKIVDEIEIEHTPSIPISDNTRVEKEDISKTVKKPDKAEKEKEILEKPKTISRGKSYLPFGKIILYSSIILIFIVLFPLLFLKYKALVIHKIPDESAEYSNKIKHLVKEGKVSIPDQLNLFKDNLRTLEEKGIKNYLPDEFKKLQDMVSNFETKTVKSGVSSDEIMQELIGIGSLFETIEDQLDLSITQEKAKAYAALKDAENVIDIITKSKLYISTQKELQDAQMEYNEAKKLIESPDPDFKKITALASDSAQKLMKMPEYHVIKLQDTEEIKLRKNADYFFDLGMYVFPENNNALKSYQQILKLHPTNQHALDRINQIKMIIKDKGDKSYDAGNMPDANVHYKEYIKLEPDNSVVRKRLSEIEKKKQKQVSFWELVVGVNPIFWIVLIGFSIAIYKYLPLVIYDIRNAYIIVGILVVFVIILMILI